MSGTGGMTRVTRGGPMGAPLCFSLAGVLCFDYKVIHL